MEMRATHLYVAFTSMDPVICGAFGLCAAFTTQNSGYGMTMCLGAPPHLRCRGPGSLPRADVRKVIATAERS
jgi:hypothetical protein